METTHPAHQLHPGVHLAFVFSGQIVNSPRGLDIKHELKPDLPTFKRQTRVDLGILSLDCHEIIEDISQPAHTDLSQYSLLTSSQSYQRNTGEHTAQASSLAVTQTTASAISEII